MKLKHDKEPTKASRKEVRYCYLKPDLSFSDSWSEESHKEYFDEDLKSFISNDEGWRLIKFEVVIGKPFEFTHNMALLTKPN